MRETEPRFLGLDLTSSERKASAYALLGEDRELLDLATAVSDAEIIAAIRRLAPHIVAIDAPLSLPRGMCCLEESCPCHSFSTKKGRSSERELAKLGIPCYFTTKRSIIKQMVYRALALRHKLCELGFEVIEVYPYASKIRLFGKPMPKKTTNAGIQFLRQRLLCLIPDLALSIDRLGHDACDAIIAAYTAYLHFRGETMPLGDTGEGIIIIPAKEASL